MFTSSRLPVTVAVSPPVSVGVDWLTCSPDTFVVRIVTDAPVRSFTAMAPPRGNASGSLCEEIVSPPLEAVAGVVSGCGFSPALGCVSRQAQRNTAANAQANT
jgi:hypothetical protein